MSSAEADPLGVQRADKRATVWGSLLGLALVLSLIVAVGIGPVQLSPDTVLHIVAQRLGFGVATTWDSSAEAIVWTVRVPRILLGAGVGAGLAVTGAVLQALVRNMLADPYVLGISSGASTGAAVVILFGFGTWAGSAALPASAFLGALLSALLVFSIARFGGRVTSLRLLLAGVAVGYALSALTSFLVFMSDSAEGSRSVMFWLLGSLALARWDAVLGIVLAVVVIATALLIAYGNHLDALAVGDEFALTIGINPDRLRIVLLVAVSLTTGVVVAASGAIGFVGLVIPHLARRLVGSVHRRTIPVAVLLGAIFLVWADVLARVVMQPRELPIGIITAMVGAPFLLLLVRRMHPGN